MYKKKHTHTQPNKVTYEEKERRNISQRTEDGTATNNLMPHLLAKVGVDKESICSAASAWSSAM